MNAELGTRQEVEIDSARVSGSVRYSMSPAVSPASYGPVAGARVDRGIDARRSRNAYQGLMGATP